VVLSSLETSYEGRKEERLSWPLFDARTRGLISLRFLDYDAAMEREKEYERLARQMDELIGELGGTTLLQIDASSLHRAEIAR
jgi:hypothetical protein